MEREGVEKKKLRGLTDRFADLGVMLSKQG